MATAKAYIEEGLAIMADVESAINVYLHTNFAEKGMDLETFTEYNNLEIGGVVNGDTVECEGFYASMGTVLVPIADLVFSS